MADEVKEAISRLNEDAVLRVRTNKGEGIVFSAAPDRLFALQKTLEENDIGTSFADAAMPSGQKALILRVRSYDTGKMKNLLDEVLALDWRHVGVARNFSALPMEEVLRLEEKYVPSTDGGASVTQVHLRGISFPEAMEFADNVGPSGNYMAIGPNARIGWVYFQAQQMEPEALGQERPQHTGWKLHISATTKDAQEQLADLAMRYRIPEFKFAPEEKIAKFQNPDYRQCGKTAVFYHADKGMDGKPVDWEGFAREAEKIVMEHGGPGPAVQRDRKVPGSNAVYYRNDRGPSGEEYLGRAQITFTMNRHNIPDAQAHNLAGLPDPFEKIDLSPVLQNEAEGQKAVKVSGREKKALPPARAPLAIESAEAFGDEKEPPSEVADIDSGKEEPAKQASGWVERLGLNGNRQNGIVFAAVTTVVAAIAMGVTMVANRSR